MIKNSINALIINLFIKLRLGKIIILLLLSCYIGFFIKFGYDYIGVSSDISYKTILSGILIAVLFIIAFFVAHFTGGFGFDLKWIIFFIGLAVGGTATGLAVGVFDGFLGWITGGITSVLSLK